MKEQSERTSILKSATVVTAIISGVTAVLAAVLPGLLASHVQPRAANETQAASPIAPSTIQVVMPITPVGAAPSSAPARAMPNLTFGAWSIVNSIDESGTDFSGSTLKFVSQREFIGGLEATGFFEWRRGSQLLGREQVVANFDASSRQIFIEGKSVESPTGTLAVGSFSARVSDDGRELLDGRWGDTPANEHGVFGKWQARR
jgi:hypothetical protein